MNLSKIIVGVMILTVIGLGWIWVNKSDKYYRNSEFEYAQTGLGLNN